MPIIQCQSCGYVIIDSSTPCPSCGNINVQSAQSPTQPLAEAAAQPPASSYSRSSNHDNKGAPSFTTGAVLLRSCSTFFKHPFVFIGLTAMAMVPGIIIMLLLKIEWVSQIVSLVSWIAIQGAITYGVYEALRGGTVPFGKSLSYCMAHIVPLIPLGILLFLGITLGMMLFVVPGVFVLCVWAVAIPACVVERLDPIESLKRSAELTKGCRMEVLGLFVRFFVAMLVIVIVSTLLFSVISMWLTGIFGHSHLYSVVFTLLIGCILAAFSSVMTAVAYYTLREVKEGVTTDSLQNAFD